MTQTPFDTALQVRELREAAEEYALSHGAPGTPEYRMARIRFGQRIRTNDDLRHWRAARAKRSRHRAGGARFLTRVERRAPRFGLRALRTAGSGRPDRCGLAVRARRG